MAEGCPIHTGTRCCLWQQTAWWAAEEQGWDISPGYSQGGQGLGLGPAEPPGRTYQPVGRAGPEEECVVSGEGVAASSN